MIASLSSCRYFSTFAPFDKLRTGFDRLRANGTQLTAVFI
jgi:hypothetical protein